MITRVLLAALAAVLPTLALAETPAMREHGTNWIAVSMFMLIIWKHTANIQRLREGKEPKIGESCHESPSV